MTNDTFPPDVLALLAEQRVTLDNLDVLLLLFRSRKLGWTVSTLARKQAGTPLTLPAVLTDLAMHGFVRALPGLQHPVWIYAPENAELDAAVQRLAELEQSHRAEVLRCLSALALDRVRRSAVRAFTPRRRPVADDDDDDDVGQD